MNRSRRIFLKNTGYALGASALLSSFKTWGAASSVLTPAAGGNYQALVCIFLYGGNDGNNTLIPYDAYADYSAVRGTAAQLNIPKSDLLQIKAASQNNQMFGLHPDMPELHSLYQAGKLAILANVGTLVQPITRQQYLAGLTPVPDQLFSHADQQNQWQTASTYVNDPLSLSGWGGRAADYLGAAAAGKLPMMITFAGNDPFTLGLSSQPFQPGTNLAGFPTVKTTSPRYEALRAILAESTSSNLVSASNRILAAAIDDSDLYAAALASAPQINTVFPNTSLGKQLLGVAQTIAARKTLGGQQQIFFCSMQGFDTHTNQLATQGSPARGSGELLLQLSQAIGAFQAAIEELQVENDVTTFTLSEFSRTLLPAAGGGSDHAWGNHHFIIGGAVRGGDIYGKFPNLKLAGPDDASSEGRWIPTTSIEQYAATLTAWFGLNAKEQAANFPNLRNFPAPNLGFMT